MMKTEARCKCGEIFVKQYHNKILVSRDCPDCRYNKAYAKRKEAIHKVIAGKRKIKPEATIQIKSNVVSKYEKKPIKALLQLATYQFNKWIRNRDKLPGNLFICPTCTNHDHKRIKGNNYQACHCFPAGLYPCLRFHELNVWGGCLQCNYFKHGANYEYNDWLMVKIGEEKYQELLDLKDYWSGRNWKWDRFFLIGIIEKYKARNLMFEKPTKNKILEGVNF